ncbi:MAG: hypothetical protein M3445_08525 [Actinomycetota bacterium]|nr:hypothetical protein [Actinomycetota bacterium]
MNSIKTAVAAFGTVALCVALGSPASAQQSDDGVGSGQIAPGSSAYSTPLQALGDRTLAQYLADHQARGPACCSY